MKLRSISLALGLVAGCVAFAPAASAEYYYTQDQQANPLADFQTQNNDPFSGRGDSTSSWMNMMHRMMKGEQTDPATFAEDQQDSMNDAMANFRAKQQQLIKQRQLQANPSTPTKQTSLVTPQTAATPITQTGTLTLTPMQFKPLVLPAK